MHRHAGALAFVVVASLYTRRGNANVAHLEGNFTNKEVPAGEYKHDWSVPSFKKTSNERINWVQKRIPEIDELYENHVKKEHIPGAIYGIVVDGKLIHTRSFGFQNTCTTEQLAVSVDTSTRFRIASMTKSFTAMAIMILVEEGRLNLSDPITKFVPSFAGDRRSTRDAPIITVEHLLTMQGGLPQDDPWGDRLLNASDEDLAIIVDNIHLEMSTSPGTVFEYSNLGYALLGLVIKSVTGMPYQQFISEAILSPLEMNDTTFEIDDSPVSKLALGYRYEPGQDEYISEPMLHDGSFGAMGGIISTLDDYVKYVVFHMAAWPPCNTPEELYISSSPSSKARYPPVTRQTLRIMHSPLAIDSVLKDALFCSHKNAPAQVIGYGMGLRWSMDSNGLVIIRHAGGLPGFGSEWRFARDHGVAVISFGNRTYSPMWSVNATALDMIIYHPFEGVDEGERVLMARCYTQPPSALALRAIQVKREISMLWCNEDKLKTLSDSDGWNRNDIFAENFFLDHSLRSRHEELLNLMAKVGGGFSSISDIVPLNQLRASFVLTGIAGKKINVLFTLTPTQPPKVQSLNFTLVE